MIRLICVGLCLSYPKPESSEFVEVEADKYRQVRPDRIGI